MLSVIFWYLLYSVATLGACFVVFIGAILATSNDVWKPRSTPRERRAHEWLEDVQRVRQGDLLRADYRGASGGSVGRGKATRDGQLRVVTWNIERGYDLERVVERLRELDADVVFLQECDLDMRRTGNVDIAGEVAVALGMQVVWACQKHSRAEDSAKRNCYGDAILTHFDVDEARVLLLPDVRADWNRRAGADGVRTIACPVVVVKTPLGRVHCWCVHLDPYTGIRGRMSQFDVVLADYERVVREERERRAADVGTSVFGGLEDRDKDVPVPCVVAGDLNTMADGYKRFMPCFCNDDLRFGSWGLSEAQYWRQHYLGERLHDPSGEVPTLKLFGGALQADKLDWMLLSPALRLRPGPREANVMVDGRDASDHCFVCMNVCLREELL